ncbi:hypothetical protein MYX06_02575 [Patescibacteria group bacterium AH-259-L05]|nr:hypothetical protein [Patescibacteria group bacterium AH-259-L05]
MSSIRQYQRRALESFKPETFEFLIRISPRDRYHHHSGILYKKNGQKNTTGKRRIFLLGISEGIGTCSDLHGINIAVFGYNQPSPHEHKKLLTKIGNGITCDWAALLRTPLPEEIKYEWNNNTSISCLVVQKLELVKRLKDGKGNRIIEFMLDQKRKLYADTI